MRPIEKLESYSTSKDGINWIIDVVNSLVVGERKDAAELVLCGGG